MPSGRGLDSSPAVVRSIFCNIQHGQIQHFQQTVIGGKDGLGLGHLAELAVKALNGVGAADQPVHLLGGLEKFKIGPVIYKNQCNIYVGSLQ